MDLTEIEKYGLKMRFVEERDAEFIMRLRTHSTLGKHLSSTSNQISDQINWIRTYKQREKLSQEFYFIFESINGDKYGTTRISEINSEFYEIGSWLFSKDSPPGTAIIADIVTKEIGFLELNTLYCKFNIRKGNSHVLRYHKAYNLDLIEEDDLSYYFHLSRRNFDLGKIKFKNIFLK